MMMLMLLLQKNEAGAPTVKNTVLILIWYTVFNVMYARVNTKTKTKTSWPLRKTDQTQRSLPGPQHCKVEGTQLNARVPILRLMKPEEQSITMYFPVSLHQCEWS